MSSFRTLKCVNMQDEATLVAALKKLGYSPKVEAGQTVRGDTTSDNRQGYEIVLKKEDTGLRGDIGFHKTETEGFKLGYDSYVIPSSKFDPTTVTGAYTVEKAKRTALRLGLRQIGETKVKVGDKTVTRLIYEKVAA
jgi:hypothetical protein